MTAPWDGFPSSGRAEGGETSAAPELATPSLDARAARPSVVKLRKAVVLGGALATSALLAGALAWAFVVQPELRANGRADASVDPPASQRNLVKPSERVTGQPATYAQLERLPEPRQFGGRRGPEAPQGAADAAAVGPSAQGGGPRIGKVQDASDPARASGLFFAASDGPAPRARPAAEPRPQGDPPVRPDSGQDDYAATYNGHGLLAPLSPFELKAGAFLPAALITAVDTSRAGPAIAVVTENVFDTVTGRSLIVPQGARLIGRHEGESRQGDKRAFLAWDRLILPNGKSIRLSEAQAVDAQGAVGVAGRVDRHLRPLALATLFAGAITTLGQAARDRDDNAAGWLGDAGGAAAIEAAQVGGRLVDRELAVRPVVRLSPGTRVRVLITRDLILEPYAP